MSTEYARREVEKILNNDGYSYPKNLAMAATWILGNLKGVNLKVLEVGTKSALADFYVLGSATNSTQAQAMADEVIRHLKKNGHKVKSCEGYNDADWILIDLGDIIVHIFIDHARSVYDLDGLWEEESLVEIPSSFYFSEPETEEAVSASSSDKDFF